MTNYFSHQSVITPRPESINFLSLQLAAKYRKNNPHEAFFKVMCLQRGSDAHKMIKDHQIGYMYSLGLVELTLSSNHVRISI